MFNKIFLFLIISSSAFWFQGQAQAEEHGHMYDAQTSVSVSAKAKNAGNKICPVMGNQIVEDAKVTYEYKGKVYNFCCEGCIEEFKKNPDKYIKKVNEELQSQVKEEVKQNEIIPKTVTPATGHGNMHH
ncbi:MAG: YHS domain-containing protein [Candidatus Omnitrophota bacterium]